MASTPSPADIAAEAEQQQAPTIRASSSFSLPVNKDLESEDGAANERDGVITTSDTMDAAEMEPSTDSVPSTASAPVKVPVSAPSSSTTSNASQPASVKPKKTTASMTVEEARAEVARWMKSTSKLSASDRETLQVLLNDHDATRDKVTKLKSLLGRSAKAQREAKVDYEASQKRLEAALKEKERLQQKLEKWSNRPTHMELLADFETNFDRALLSVSTQQQQQQQHAAHQQQQASGQDTAPQSAAGQSYDEATNATGGHKTTGSKQPVVDALLMQELSDTKARLEKLEKLNVTLQHRTHQVEQEYHAIKLQAEQLQQQLKHSDLEKRMAVMEAEHATKQLQEKAAVVSEMQLELDLVTRASQKAAARAASTELTKTDRHHVQQLEAQVQALQEWALASAEAKTLAQERVHLLEHQLQQLKRDTLASTVVPGSSLSSPERVLLSNVGSLVVGAGDVGFRTVQLTEEMLATLLHTERVVLRWKFDLCSASSAPSSNGSNGSSNSSSTSSTLTVDFAIYKGIVETAMQRRMATTAVKERTVVSGAAGEVDAAFTTNNACTVTWSNAKSWIRPRTIKYTLAVLAIAD